jgi:hypothetical protein
MLENSIDILGIMCFIFWAVCALYSGQYVLYILGSCALYSGQYVLLTYCPLLLSIPLHFILMDFEGTVRFKPLYGNTRDITTFNSLLQSFFFFIMSGLFLLEFTYTAVDLLNSCWGPLTRGTVIHLHRRSQNIHDLFVIQICDLRLYWPCTACETLHSEFRKIVNCTWSKCLNSGRNLLLHLFLFTRHGPVVSCIRNLK